MDDHLGGWPLVEALIELSRKARFREPKKMLELAIAALGAAHNLDRQRYTPGVIRDFQAAAWAELGNAYRVNEDYGGAEDAFAQSNTALNEGTGDPIALARLLDFQASLRTAQRRVAEAVELQDNVFRLYDGVGECHLAGRALISKGISIRWGGRLREAVDLLRHGMEMLDPGRDPQLMAIGQHNLLEAFVELGEFREAQRLLLASGLRRSFAAEPINLLRLRWVEGKIYGGLGKLWRADTILQDVREGFLQRGLEHDAAVVGLELLDVWLQQRRTVEVRQLASEILQTFEAMEIEHEALRAVRFLEEACRRDEASAALVQRVVQFLRRLEWEPRLQFAT
jgi:tetratricopeptide (TPR) repeat protein